MDKPREIRKILIDIPEPTKQPTGHRPELREGTIDIVFSEGPPSTLRILSTMNPWPTDDLLKELRDFISQLRV